MNVAEIEAPDEVAMSDEPFRPRRPGLQSRLWREMTRLVFRYMANPALPVEVRRRRLERLSRTVSLPAGTHVQAVSAGGMPAEWVVPPRVDSEAVLLYFHGGTCHRDRSAG